MRPPVSTSENRAHDAKKFGPRRYFDFFNKIGPKADMKSLTGRNPSFRHSGHAHPFYQTVSLNSDRPDCRSLRCRRHNANATAGWPAQSKLAFDRSWASYWPVSEVFFGWLKASFAGGCHLASFPGIVQNIQSREHRAHEANQDLKHRQVRLPCERDPSLPPVSAPALWDLGPIQVMIRGWLGHRSIQHAVRYSQLSTAPFVDCWR